jgi:hypothetical protein
MQGSRASTDVAAIFPLGSLLHRLINRWWITGVCSRATRGPRAAITRPTHGRPNDPGTAGAFPPDNAAYPVPEQRWEADRLRELILEEGLSAFEARERVAREREGRP